ncbi:MAG: type III-A CRISPR-associated protein Csm2 [Anaerolineae bacterium]
MALSQTDLQKIIQTDEGTELLVREADKLGSDLARQLTTNQIRAIFGEVRRIEGDWKIDPKRANKNLILLKPKMAYRAKRERGRGVQDLVAVLDPAIDLVQGKEENFTRFVEFFEAILAYHKAYGGS